MPKYKVKEKGFYNGVLYSPKGKRTMLFTDKPLKPVPMWLVPMVSETPSEMKKRLAAEKKADAADKKKADSDKKDIVDLTFMGTGEKASVVETL